MGKNLKDHYTFVSTEERSLAWQQPGVLFYTINQDLHSDWLWHCWVQRVYVPQKLSMNIISLNYCFTGTAYPALQLFAIDKDKGQIHWLEQTDGVMGGRHQDTNTDDNYGPRPVFAPWHCLITTKLGEEPTVFRAAAPLTTGTDEVMLFAVDKNAKLWALRRDLTNAQVWNATKVTYNGQQMLVKKLANDQFAQLVPGTTPDGRPQVFFSGNPESGLEGIWRVRLNNDIWTVEQIVNG
jgi:hypothetical protein